MAVPPGKAWAISAASGIVAALAGCAGSPRGTVAATEMPEYPPPQEKPGTSQATADRPAKPRGGVASPVDGSRHCCKGQNDCKGKGNCKTDRNACKGMNECKGQGGCRGVDCH